MDINKCHFCKLDNNHYARPADNFDMTLHGIAKGFEANVGVTVFAAHDQNNPQCLFKEYSSTSTIKVTTKQVCVSSTVPCNIVVLVNIFI